MERMDQPVTATARTRSRVTQRAAWSPAQLVAGLGGLLYLIIGAVALAQAGTDFSNIAATHTTVMGLHYTCLSAVVQMAAGALLLVGAVGPEVAKAMAAVLGVASVVWGIVIIADVTGLYLTWGYTRSTGVFYIIVGAGLLFGGVASPVFSSREREVVVR
jgi:hypothetical protein